MAAVTQLRDEKGRFAKADKPLAFLYHPDDVELEMDNNLPLVTVISKHPALRVTLRKDLKVGLLLLVALNLFDLASTFTAIRLGAHEANPLARLLLGFSPLTLIAMKAVVVGLILWASAKVPVERVVTRVWLLVGVYAMVVLNNSVVVWRLAHA